MNESAHGLSTRCVHDGEITDPQGAPHTPIYNSTTFVFEDTKSLLDVVEGRKPGNLYTRYGLNPSIKSLESKLASIEFGEAALAFSSGMASEAALFLALGRRGIVCIGDAYGGTLELLDDQIRSLNIPVYFLLGSDLDRLDALLDKGVDLVFLETPTNPALEIFDIRDLAERAHKMGALLVVDNTFATPVNQNPLLLGADLVVHSATKYLGGHSDITAGALIGPASLIEKVGPWRKNLGQMLAPETASLLSRSLRTLVPRVKQQNESASAIAQALARHPKVQRVLYPGLPDFPGHALAKRQMSGFGGMMTMELDSDETGTRKVADSFRIFRIAPSLGGAESLCTQPVTTTHHGLPEMERQRRGITGSMIRFSIGFEDASDLIADIEQALKSI